MKQVRIERTLAVALFTLASLSVSACGSGGATIGSGGPGLTGSGSGSGSGSGTGSGSGSASPSPAASASGSGTGTGSGGGTATASPTPSAAATATASAAASSTSTPSSLDALSVYPAVLDGDLGGVAQIGILDPNYTGPYSVTVTGAGLLSNTLSTLSNVVNGTLTGSPNGETTLSLNLANALQLGLLGPSGNALTICEQQNPSTCKSVNITNNGLVPMVGSTVSSIVFSPSGIQTIGVVAPLLVLSDFQVIGTPQGISATNLGNGQFVIDAAANIAVPTTGYVTISDGTHTLNIPISVL